MSKYPDPLPTAQAAQDRADPHWFLIAGEAMSERVRHLDWAASPLGPLDDWTTQLKSLVGMVLASPFPSLLWWGQDLIQIYNDAARVCFDALNQPAALGGRAPVWWDGDWPTLAPHLEQVAHSGRAVCIPDMLIPAERNGRMKERYWACSFTPLVDGATLLTGLCVVFAESTSQVLFARRQAVLDHLRSTLAVCQAREQVAALVQQAAATSPSDIQQLRLPHGAALSMPGQRVAIRAVELHLAGRLEVEFVIADALPFDEPYRRFLEQFTGIVASTLQRLDSEAVRQIAKAERDRLLLDAPVGAAVMTGAELTYQLVNAMYAMVSGRSAEEMVGKPFLEVFPELAGTAVERSFTSAYQSGTAVVGEATLVRIHRHGGALEDRYFTYNLSPLRRLDGAVYGLMVIAVDVTLQVQSRTQIEELNQQLTASSRAKDEFLALLGHELRNPLAPIVTALELMKSRDNSTQREQAVIERQVSHLRRLVDDLLDVSRITRGKVDLRKQVISLREVLGKAVEMVQPAIERKRQFLALEVAPLRVFADPDRLTQVISNLLGNASRYTQEGGHLSLRAQRQGTQLQIVMRDDGAGISAALLPHIFEPFVQGARKLQGAVGGLGIGLALVKNLVEMHGGTALAESAGENLGSTFTISLPIEVESGDVDDSSNSASAILAKATGDEAQLVAGAAPATYDIVIVDDNQDAADFLAELLASQGHAVRVAYDSRTALAHCSAAAPQIAILDIGLPDMSGYQLADRLRNIAGCHDLPCIALTGYGQESDRQQSRAQGFAAHLVKPVEHDALLEALHSCAVFGAESAAP